MSPVIAVSLFTLLVLAGCDAQDAVVATTVIPETEPMDAPDRSPSTPLPGGAIHCPLTLDFEGERPPTMEYMPVLASDGKVYANWQDACTNPAVAWYYPFDHPETLAAKERVESADPPPRE